MRIRANKLAEDAPNLTHGFEYIVVGLDQDSFRVINDRNEPVIYPKELFEVIDGTFPNHWKWKKYGEDEFVVSPSELSGRGFYEDWHDGVPAARAIFDEYIRMLKKTDESGG